jgi:hypothetical protein
LASILAECRKNITPQETYDALAAELADVLEDHGAVADVMLVQDQTMLWAS